MIDVETFAAAKAYTDAHGGEGGTSNYNALENKPQINAVELSGNKTASELGLVASVEGKGLSTNDYDDTEKGKVADNTGAIEAIENVLGAKNLLPLKLADIKGEPENTGTWSGNSYTYGGVTFTFTVDSNDYVIDITTSGMSTEAFNITFRRHAEGFSKYSGMLLNGCAKVNNVTMYILLDVSPYTEYALDAGEGATIATIPDGSRVWFGINVNGAGIDMNNLHFKPMIRDARITDPTYVPYAMTNRELTDVVNRGSVSVTADGVKDTGALFDELMALVDKYKLSSTSYVIFGNDCYRWQYTGSTLNIPFTQVYVEIDKLYVNTLRYTTGGSAWYQYTSTNGVQNRTSEVLSSGYPIILYY